MEQECKIHTTVISCWKQSNQLPMSKTLKPIHNTLMGSYDQLQFVSLTELCYSIRLKI